MTDDPLAPIIRRIDRALTRIERSVAHAAEIDQRKSMEIERLRGDNATIRKETHDVIMMIDSVLAQSDAPASEPLPAEAYHG